MFHEVYSLIVKNDQLNLCSYVLTYTVQEKKVDPKELAQSMTLILMLLYLPV